jgi:uncharacterized protein YrzB (UPF0473 family)
MPSCNDSGYGVLTEDKQFIRFDEGGNQKVRKLLAETDKDAAGKRVVVLNPHMLEKSAAA